MQYIHEGAHMLNENTLFIIDPTNPLGKTPVQVGDLIATQSMPHRPVRVTHIVAGIDEPMIAGTFKRGGSTVITGKALTSCFLMKRPQAELPMVGEPPTGCTQARFMKWYEAQGGTREHWEQTWASKEAGHTILSDRYKALLAREGVPYPFASSEQGAKPVAVNENVLHDDPYPAADCTKLELAVWLGAHWGLKLTEEMELYHRSGWNVSSDEYRDMIEHQYDDMEDGGTEAA